MPFGRNHYVSALEKRVAELEDFLLKKGLLDQVSSFTPYSLSGPSSVSDDPGPLAALANPMPRTRTSSLDEAVSQTSDIEHGNSMSRILRDLSLESNGGYIGASSHFTIGRLMSSIVQGKRRTLQETDSPDQGAHGPSRSECPDIKLADVPPDVASKLFYGYMKHVATRYPVLQSSWIHDLHRRRESISNAYERSTLHLVYAIAGRFLETTGETSLHVFPERHQAQVLKDLDEMLHYHDTRSVVTLLLLAVYSLRAEGGPGAWAYIGLAMRIAIDLGLHRQTSTMNRLGFDVEMRKRLFWSCYTMDRQISIPLGRPFSISDSDIDVAIPFDLDESSQNIEALEHASRLDPDTPRTESTSLTAFLHILRLRRIESSIQQTIYRVDQPVNITDAEVDHYLEQLEHWRSTIPKDAKSHVDRESVAFDGYDYYMVFYYKCHRLLLYPLISKPHPDGRYLKACAKVCGGVAQSYKRLHQTLSVGYSLMALQTVFMAGQFRNHSRGAFAELTRSGLTLVYCAWLSPEDIFNSTVSNDVNACCIVLFVRSSLPSRQHNAAEQLQRRVYSARLWLRVITERWPAARKYRDAFEIVKQIVIDPLSDSQNHQPRRAVSTLPSVELPLDEGRQQYDSIVTHMSGGAMEGMAPPFSQPMAIGMEQVQYQMGSNGFDDGLLCSALRKGIPAAGGIDRQALGLAGVDPSHSLDAWASVEGMTGDMGFSTDIEPFDLEGCSVDMGWMADSFATIT
ncbi:hypothetical protein LTR17_020204 [Elasticomyces elasticus]|nr:hypothetical protein LTR17_020204 [Elasticomyces elasticus]